MNWLHIKSTVTLHRACLTELDFVSGYIDMEINLKFILVDVTCSTRALINVGLSI